MADNSGSSQFDGTSAFASAVARARQIAAKITPGSGDAPVPGIKRTMDDVASFGEPDSKKIAGDSSIGAQLRAIADSQPGFGAAPTNTEAARAAQEAAARINRQLGINNDNNMQSQKPGMPMGAGGMMVQTEEHRVPDKMVGLIIGKGGEQITRLQAETGCKVQIAPDSAGSDMRPCQLTGAPQAIMECKRQMNLIIERGQGSQPMGGGGMDGGMGGEGNTVVEMNIPGSKVGLIIGKGGETIRQLQESANVKMVMIQDSNSPTAQDKPLRISGDPQRCQRAKEMVLELLAEKDGVPPRGNMFNEYGSQQFGNNFNDGGMGSGPGMDISVPRQGVGLVIGKKGEMIQKIQNETGAKVQFKTDDGQSQDRICSVTGPQDKVQQAIQKIQDLLAKANIMGHPIHKGPGGFGGPMGPGHMNDMNRGPGGPFSPPGGRGPGGMGGFDNNMQDTTTYTVPADKCGLVIGKGGENIREIIRQTGAHVELDRNPPPNMTDKLFKIRGNPGQIQAAINMIQEKTGQQGGPDFNQGHGPVGGGMMGGPHGGGPNGPPGGPGGPGPQGPGGFDQFGGQFGQNQPQQQFGGAPQGAPQGWNAYGNQYPQQQQPNMANKPSNDANAAAWAYYYAYGGGQPGQQPSAPQQPAAPQQQPAQPQQPSQISYAQPNNVNHTINPQTGQPDYSQAWVEYYRSQGMLHEAQMVLQQVAQNQGNAGGQGGQPGQP